MARINRMKRNAGFTLTELLIAVAIISLVMAIGVPSMTEFIKNDRLVTQINRLVGHLAYARSEAVLRHQPVIVCASGTQTSCSTTNWASGWASRRSLPSVRKRFAISSGPMMR